MRRSVLRGLGAAALVIGAAHAATAQLAEGIGNYIVHGVPVVGLDVGAAIPISRFQDTARPGGAIAPFVGYQMGGSFTFTPILQPQIAIFSACDCGETPSITSATAGARFAFNDGPGEVYFGAQGGYYWSTSGPTEHDNGAGFNFQGGFNYDFWTGTGLGLYIRYDQADICPTRPKALAETDITEFLVTGLEVRHRFLPPPPAPPPPAPVVAQAPPAAPVKQKIVLRGVNFDFDKSDIRPDAVPILDQAAATLKEYGSVIIAVNGYTDSIGSDAYNERLSLRRANAVRAYLEAHGVAASRMTVKGFGEADPVASNDTAEGRAQNRRVELIVNQ